MCLFGFVVLNFEDAFDTIKCVDSICKAAEGNEYYVIVVDNGSKDDSLAVIEKKYANEYNIDIIANNENLGFSKGMNVGFIIAKKKFKCDFIFLVNNDTMMLTADFLEIVQEDYKKYKYAVLGPRIISSPQMQNNPYVQIEKTPHEMLQLLSKRYKKYKLREIAYFFGFGLIRRSIRFFLLNHIRENDLKMTDIDSIHLETEREIRLNSGLHGSFLVFSPIYVQEFDGIEDVTFAYGEEWLIYNRCRERGWLMVYEPRIAIVHEGDLVSKKSTTNLRKRVLNKTKLEIDSNRKLRKYIIDNYMRLV